MNKKIDEMTFEEAFEKLNEILEKFESGEVSLEKSIKSPFTVISLPAHFNDLYMLRISFQQGFAKGALGLFPDICMLYFTASS